MAYRIVIQNRDLNKIICYGLNFFGVNDWIMYTIIWTVIFLLYLAIDNNWDLTWILRVKRCMYYLSWQIMISNNGVFSWI